MNFDHILSPPQTALRSNPTLYLPNFVPSLNKQTKALKYSFAAHMCLDM